MPIASYLLQGAGFGLAAAVQPGPFLAYLVSRTLADGWRRTLPAALAPLISDGPIIALMLLLLTRLPESFRIGLHLASGAFLLFLTRGAFLSWRGDRPAGADTRKLTRRNLTHAAFMNLLSPGPYLFWSLATGPVLLDAWKRAPGNAAGFLAGFYGVMVGSLAVLIILFGTTAGLGPRVNRFLLAISAAALGIFGLFQIWQGLALLGVLPGK